MPVTFVIPSALRPLAGGQDRVRVEASVRTAEQALNALWALHPALRLRIVTEQGEVRPHVNVFVGTESIRQAGGLMTPVTNGDEIAIIAAVSGGTIG
jgi:molybdopterin converting factor small subunit